MSIEQNVMIVGAGVSGLTTAIYAKLAGYKEVICAERGAGPASGNSGIIAQAHSGIEYPNDPQSGIDCLEGLMMFVHCLPPQIFVGEVTRVLVAKGKEELIPIVENHIFNILAPHYREHGKKFDYNLGTPDAAFRKLQDDEYADAPHIIAGYITPQRTINSAILATVLQAYAEQLGVKFLFNHEVTNISKQDKYTIICQKPNDEFITIESDIIALTAYDRNTFLAQMVNPNYNDGNLSVSLREIPIVTRKSETFTSPTRASFTLKDELGGMDAPVSDDCRIIYRPSSKAGHASNTVPLSQIIPCWALELVEPHPTSVRAKNTKKDLEKHIYPWLQDFEIAGTYKKLVILGGDQDVDKRPNRKQREVADGMFDLIAMKATYCVLNAKEITQAFLAYSLSQGVISTSQYTIALNNVAKGIIPLADKYVDNFSALEKDAKIIAKRANLPDNFISKISSDRKIAPLPSAPIIPPTDFVSPSTFETNATPPLIHPRQGPSPS